MYKLLLTLALCSVTFFANAQRYADLEFSLLHPTTVKLIQPFDTVNFKFSVKNLGPDVISYSDSLKYYATINGNPILFNNGQDSFMVYSEYLLPGDSMIDSIGPMIFIPQDTIVYCFTFVPYSSVDTVFDTLMGNNTDCAIIVLIDTIADTTIDTTTVVHHNYKSKDRIKVHPNPARQHLTIDIDAAENSDIVLVLSDITGRVVYKKRQSITANAKHVMSVDVSGFNRGLYLYKITNGNDITTGKIMLE